MLFRNRVIQEGSNPDRMFVRAAGLPRAALLTGEFRNPASDSLLPQAESSARLQGMFEEPRDALYLLQRWYLTQCDNEWEHGRGISISTLDNPGWRLRVDLTDTALAGLTAGWSKVERSEHDWLHWRVHEAAFDAACGPTNLNEAILAFLDLTGARPE